MSKTIPLGAPMLRLHILLILALVGCSTTSKKPTQVLLQGQVQAQRLTAPSISAATSRELKLHFINVGQGAATLVELPCGVALIDVGGERGIAKVALSDYLTRFFESRPHFQNSIDLLLITHPHQDHADQLNYVLDTYNVKAVAYTAKRLQHARFSPHQRLATWEDSPESIVVALDSIPHEGMLNPVVNRFVCDGVSTRITLLWAATKEKPKGWNSHEFKNPNNHSLVIRIDYGQFSAIFTGDLEDTAIAPLVERYAATSLLDINLYSVGHHGSHNGTTEGLLQAMTPELAVISAGSWCRKGPMTAHQYGHPRTEVLSMLEDTLRSPKGRTDRPLSACAFKKCERGDKACERLAPTAINKAIYSTSWDGNVLVSASPDGNVSVETDKSAPDGCACEN